jgi:hypothetical protein
MSSCTPMWVWVYSRGPFTYPSWWIQLVCGWSTFGCLAVFPRHKGRKTVSLFLLFDYLRALIFKPLRSMEYDCSWAMQLAETFLSRCFRFSRWGFMLTCRTTADQACFCTSQLCLWINNQFLKIFLLWTLQSSATIKNCMANRAPSSSSCYHRTGRGTLHRDDSSFLFDEMRGIQQLVSVHEVPTIDCANE